MENGQQEVSPPPGPLVHSAGPVAVMETSVPRPIAGPSSCGSGSPGADNAPYPFAAQAQLGIAPGDPIAGTSAIPSFPINTVFRDRESVGEQLARTMKAFKRPQESLSPAKEAPKRARLGVKQLTRRGRVQVSESDIRERANTDLNDLLGPDSRTNVFHTHEGIIKLNELIKRTGNVRHDIAQAGNSLLILVGLADELWREMRERYGMLLAEATAERVARLALEDRVKALELRESQAHRESDRSANELHELRLQNTALLQKVEELTKTLAEHVAATSNHPQVTAPSAEILALREEKRAMSEELANLVETVRTLEQAQLATESAHSEELSKLKAEKDLLLAKLKNQGTNVSGKSANSGKRKSKKPGPPQSTPDGGGQAPEPPIPTKEKGKGDDHGGDDGFIVVKRKRDPRTKPRSKSEAVVIKAEEDQYAKILTTMRTDPKLKGLGKDTRLVRRTRNNELLLVLGRGAKGACEYVNLVKQVVGTEGTEVRAVGSETSIQCKHLDETVTSEILLSAIAEQCGTGELHTPVKFKRYSQRMQTAILRLPKTIADMVLRVGKIKVNWSICPVSPFDRPDACYKCFDYGHKAWACKGPDRSKLCRRCGQGGHKAKGCKAPPRCLLCAEDSNKHATGSSTCPSYRRAIKKK